MTGFDLDRRIVHATTAAHLRDLEIPYDSLIVAAGVNQSYFGHDELARYAPGMKTIDDALELRRRIFGAFEMAEVADRSRRAGEVADRGHRRRRADRRRAGRTGPRAGGALPQGRVPHVRSGVGARAPARRWQGAARHVRRPALRQGDQGVASASAWSCGWAPGSSASTRSASTSPAPTAASRGSRPTRRSGRPACRRRRSPPSWPKPAGPSSTAPAASPVLPDLTLPGHPEVFAVGDMATVEQPAGRGRGRHAGRAPRRQHDLAAARTARTPCRSSTATSAAWRRSGGSAPSPACARFASAGSPGGWCGSSCTSPSSPASATASRR